ncbi:unnamed protein product [Mytilus coruscus]|uniref:Uncharacterized protein n=1 Tax=Mytilus coruscus TaxID=42192 RepID=A0A6J8CSB2_MYTCO|nr:unnamed protein product [Mytilus coruscus]
MASSSSSAVSGLLRTNYARIGHAAQQLFPDILQELITIIEPPQRLSHDVHKNKYLSKNLRSDEWSMINNVVTKGYANFDIPLIYKLVRNLNLVPWPTKGWDHPTAPCLTEVTPGDDIERIRRFRNETLHRGNAQVTDTELSQYFTEFKNIADRLEKYLRKHRGEYVDKFVDLETCCMDEKTSDMYIRRIERLKKSDEDCKKRIHAVEKDVYALKEKSTSQTEEFDNTAKQLDALELKEEVHGKEIKDLQVNQQSQAEELENTAKQLDALELKEEVHGKEIKDLQVNQQSQAEGLEKTATEHSNKLDECKMETNKIRKVQTQHTERFENLEQKTESLKLKEEVHGKEIKDLQEILQDPRKRNLIDQTESRINRFMEDTKESFVETETQRRVLNILARENCLVMISKGGRGKTALCLQLASNFRNKGFTPMYVVNNEIETIRDIIDFRNRHFIIVDDLFGQTNANINDHTLKVIYDSVKSENCESKVILNIRESPGCNKSILESHSILRETQVINLDDETYDLSLSEKKEILLKHMKKFNVSLCHCDFSNLCKESIYTDTDNQSLVVCRSTVEQIIECKTLEGFPEACHMFCSDNTLTLLGLSYFKNTRESLVNTMKNLCAEGFDKTQKKYQYSTLVYVALKGNIDLNYLNESLLLGILSYYEQKDKKIKQTLVSKALHDLSLNGKYLVKDREDETYCFQHATICEAVLISYGEECPEDLLPSCSARFFQEYIRPESYRKFKKPNHVYLFVSDKVLSNNLLSLCVKKHKFKSALSGISQKDNKKPPTETDNSHSTSNNDTDLNEDQYIYKENTDPGYDTYFIDCSLNPMHHRKIGQYLFDMGIRNELDSFVNMFLSSLSSCFLETEKISPDLMKFFFDGLTFHGEWSEAVSRYFDFCKTYLFKYGSYAVILSFVKPSSNTDKCNWTFVPVKDELLVKKLIEIFFKTWNCVSDDEEEEYEFHVRNKCKHVIMECLHQPQSHIMRWQIKDPSLEKIGEYLYSIMEKDSDFVNLILFQLIYITNRYYVNPFIMMSLLDGLTDHGKHFDVISANYDFCTECLFKYGSTPVVLSLCRPSSYEGSDQDIVRVDNQLLANKLIENLKYTDEDFAEFDYKYVPSEKCCYRPCRSNIRYIFFEDEDYFEMTYFYNIASYIYNYGVLENDEEFIEAVRTAIDLFENIEEEDGHTFISEQMYGPRDPLTLCDSRLENLKDSFSTSEVRKIKRKFPCLINSLSISYYTDELSSDSDENSDTSKQEWVCKTDHEDEDINEPETSVDVDGHESDKYRYEESNNNESDYFESGDIIDQENYEGGEGNAKEIEKDDGIHE